MLSPFTNRIGPYGMIVSLNVSLPSVSISFARSVDFARSSASPITCIAP